MTCLLAETFIHVGLLLVIHLASFGWNTAIISEMRGAHATPAPELDSWTRGVPHLPLSEITRIEITAAWQHQHKRSAQLFRAAEHGQVKIVNQLLSEGTDPEWLDPERGITALHVATMHGRAACVLSLLRAGADIHAKGAHGCTPLELFGFGASWFWVADRMCKSCNYKACQRYLLKAHDASRARFKYQGFAVIHPGGEFGLVHDKACSVDKVRTQIDCQLIVGPLPQL